MISEYGCGLLSLMIKCCTITIESDLFLECEFYGIATMTC